MVEKHRQANTLTTKPHLTTRRQDCLQHLADLDVPKLPSNTVATHTVLNNGHYPE
jgi:hypothetical protein